MHINSDQYFPMQRLLGWTLFWFTLYCTCFKISRKKHPEYNCRIIALLHASLLTGASCYCSFFSGYNPFRELGLPNTYQQTFIVTTSLGYFLYDFLWCLYHRTEGPAMMLHHVTCVFMLSTCLVLGISGTEVVGTIFGSEITTIVLNVRWFMKAHNMYENPALRFLVDFLFVALFLCVRLGVGGYLLYCTLLSTRSLTFVKMGGGALYFVNWIFFAQILSFIRYRYKKWQGTSSPNRSDEIRNHEKRNGVSDNLAKGDACHLRKRSLIANGNMHN